MLQGRLKLNAAEAGPAFLAMMLLLAQLSTAVVWAQQAVQTGSGSPFMEELTDDGKTLPLPSISPSNHAVQSGQQIHNDDGSLFMEELPQKKKPHQKPVPQIDFSSLGVPVDGNGRIIPLLNGAGGAPVMRNFSRLELDYTPPAVYVPYNIATGPYGFVPQRTPLGVYPLPVYRTQQIGALAVPLGIPRSYFSSSDLPQAAQQSNFQFSGSCLNYPGVWSPGWRSPFGGAGWLPQLTQFEQQGSVRSFFPGNLN